MSKFPATIKVRVTPSDINEGKCKDPNKCMLKLAIKREIGGHGYVNVKGGVASITRRADYREKGFLPRSALKAMLDFDNRREVKPFTFNITFYKTTKITNRERMDQMNAITRKNRAKPGYKAKKYTMRQRIAGIAVGEAVAT